MGRDGEKEGREERKGEGGQREDQMKEGEKKVGAGASSLGRGSTCPGPHIQLLEKLTLAFSSMRTTSTSATNTRENKSTSE